MPDLIVAREETREPLAWDHIQVNEFADLIARPAGRSVVTIT
jgi:hypothetical protein